MSNGTTSRTVLKDKFVCSTEGCSLESKPVVCYSASGKRRGTFWRCAQDHVNKGRLKKTVEVEKA